MIGHSARPAGGRITPRILALLRVIVAPSLREGRIAQNLDAPGPARRAAVVVSLAAEGIAPI